MRYCNKEQGIQSVNNEIENYRRCITLIETIKTAIGKFDGKIINKRFETALFEATGARIRTEIFYDTFALKVFPISPGVPDDNITPYHYSGCDTEYYLTDGAFVGGTFAKRRYINKNDYEVTKTTDTGKHRLIAENLIKALDNRRAELEARISEIRIALGQVDKYEAMVQEMEKMEKEIRKLPYEIRQWFNLNISINYS